MVFLLLGSEKLSLWISIKYAAVKGTGAVQADRLVGKATFNFI